MTATVLGRAPLARRRESGRVPVVVVAAHPDDETLGASALLLRSPGCAVVHLTDGAPRERTFWPAGFSGSRGEYAAARRHELREALAIAGVAPERTFGLGAPDQDAALHLAPLARSLAELLRSLRPRRVVTHPYEGGHPDHDAAAFVARAALGLLRDGGAPAVPPLFEMTSYHAGPDGQLRTFEFLEPGTGPVHTRVLDEVERDAKARMLAAFRSQREVIAWFPREVERLRRAPSCDFARPPHPGALWYERMQFPISGAEWRARAAEALAALARGQSGAEHEAGLEREARRG